VILPRLHWETENSVLYAHRHQVSGQGQAVGTCSDNRYIYLTTHLLD
jgi:hypothetical protein